MADGSRQNWLLISFDQWRGDWLHQPWLQLPTLQALARQGHDARRCYTASPQCVPARASWLTGLRPSALGVTENQPYTVPGDAPSFVRNLRDGHGYRTVLLGKTHWTPHQPGVDLRDNRPLLNRLGFEHVREIAGPRALAVLHCELGDLWQAAGVMEAYRRDLEDRYRDGCLTTVRPTPLPDALYPDLWLAEMACTELQALPGDRPWLLWVSFVGPHEPFDVPRSYRGRHDPARIPPALPRPAQALQQHGPDTVLGRKLRRWPDGLPAATLRALRADYADHLALLDAQVARLLAALQRRPDAAQTAISVCSDHGELLGDWGLLLKGCFLEGACRSLFVHRPAPAAAAAVAGAAKPAQPSRAYGLTELMAAAARAVSEPQQGSFGERMLATPRTVRIELADESLALS